jgi:surface antigen
MYAHDWPAAAADDLAHPQPGWVATTRPRIGDVVLWVAGQQEVAYFQDGTPAPIGVASGAGHVGVVTWVYPKGAIQVAMYNVWWAPLGFDTEKMRSSGHFLHHV